MWKTICRGLETGTGHDEIGFLDYKRLGFVNVIRVELHLEEGAF